MQPADVYSESALTHRGYSVERVGPQQLFGKFRLAKGGTSVWVQFNKTADAAGRPVWETTLERIQRGFFEANKPFPREFEPTEEEMQRLRKGGRSPRRSPRVMQQLPASPPETVRTNGDDRGQDPRDPERRVRFAATEMELMEGWKFDEDLNLYMDYSGFGRTVDWLRPVQPRRPAGEPGDPDPHEENREEHE